MKSCIGDQMTHAAEVRYRSLLPDETRVWYKKKKKSKWALLDHEPNWNPKYTYVCDDEWASLAKQFIDDPKKIEYKSGDKWHNLSKFNDVDTLRFGDVDCFRIKPKKVDYYQWMWLDFEGLWRISTGHYYSASEAASAIGIVKDDNVKAFKPSKVKK